MCNRKITMINQYRKEKFYEVLGLVTHEKLEIF